MARMRSNPIQNTGPQGNVLDLYPSLSRHWHNGRRQGQPNAPYLNGHVNGVEIREVERDVSLYWDLYPNLSREIENRGSEEQRRVLHSLREQPAIPTV
ncbi:uncharacterized protein VTP21DRAFT_1706 [Calcarisporiella thermophila]|uniref:uncharacterized protein n=1 Tax=Calcarisporiella thermophila TaxID=911321 RepID=UPI003743B19B